MFSHRNNLPKMSADHQPQKSSRSWIFLVARWAAALLILGILFYLLPVEPLRNALSHVPSRAHCRAADLSGGPDRRHHQVDTVVNSAGAQLASEPARSATPAAVRRALSAIDYRRRRGAPRRWNFAQSRPAAVITGNVADAFSM